MRRVEEDMESKRRGSLCSRVIIFNDCSEHHVYQILPLTLPNNNTLKSNTEFHTLIRTQITKTSTIYFKIIHSNMTLPVKTNQRPTHLIFLYNRTLKLKIIDNDTQIITHDTARQNYFVPNVNVQRKDIV